MKKDNSNDFVINDDVKELVLARLDIMPQNFKLALGNQGVYTKEELINNVKEGNTVGVQVINMEMSFIKALTSGKFIEAINQYA